MKVDGADQYKRLARRLREAGRGICSATDPGHSAGGRSGAGGGAGGVGDGGRVLVRRWRRRTRQFDWFAGADGGGYQDFRARIRDPGAGGCVAGRPRYGATLTKGLDGLGTWRHPCSATPTTGRVSAGREVFYSTLTGFESVWRAGVLRAMEETARQIAG